MTSEGYEPPVSPMLSEMRVQSDAVPMLHEIYCAPLFELPDVDQIAARFFDNELDHDAGVNAGCRVHSRVSPSVLAGQV